MSLVANRIADKKMITQIFLSQLECCCIPWPIFVFHWKVREVFLNSQIKIINT